MFTAVIRLLMPPDALQSAARIETTRPIVSAPPLRVVMFLSSSPMSSAALFGRFLARLSTSLLTEAGEATRP